jgi:sugar O-acyltransferase (sialic acid O-acetyltransferase NeuD family)
MTAAPIVVFGAGGHGKVVADVLLAAREDVLGFLDDSAAVGARVLGLPVLGGASWFEEHPAVRVALGIGNNEARARVAAACEARGLRLVSAVHPRAVVSSSARVDEGAVIMALAVVNPDAVVGRGAIVNSGAVIEHDCVLGPFAHVSPNASLGGACKVGAFAHLGIGATMLPGTSVGERTIVGGGAVVTRALPPDVVALGIPARIGRRLV